MDKDASGGITNVKKVLLDPDNGLIFDNGGSDLSRPVFPSRRRKREVADVEKALSEADPNGHSHNAAGDQMSPVDFAAAAAARKRREATPKKTIQYQKSGGNTDYDYDLVQQEEDRDAGQSEGENEPGGENGNEEEQEPNVFEPTGENDEEQENDPQTRKRRVRVGFAQSGALPAGAKETISAGGGRSPGHHEGGGLTVRVRKSSTNDGGRRRQDDRDRRSKTINFYFTW